MEDYTHVGNGVCNDKSLVKATGMSQVMLTAQGTQELLKDNIRSNMDPTYQPGRLIQAPSYLLGKPLHDFDATGNGVRILHTVFYLVLGTYTSLNLRQRLYHYAVSAIAPFIRRIITRKN